MIMKVASTQDTAVLRNAYRTTFQEYSNKLDALQRLMSSGTPDSITPDSITIDAAVLEVEKARQAHSIARDQLARELVRPPAARTGEHHIRETARLLWEVAGRPEGSAERDWRRAEQLVHAAPSSSC